MHQITWSNWNGCQVARTAQAPPRTCFKCGPSGYGSWPILPTLRASAAAPKSRLANVARLKSSCRNALPARQTQWYRDRQVERQTETDRQNRYAYSRIVCDCFALIERVSAPKHIAACMKTHPLVDMPKAKLLFVTLQHCIPMKLSTQR